MKYAGLIKHGECRRGQESREYMIWSGIRKRIYDTGCKIYPYYGGRGIKLCDRWQDFNNFLADMDRRPSKDHSIDRIDSNGDYSPENCRWATRKEQMRNKSDNVLLTLNGETYCVAEWAERLGLTQQCI